MTRSRRGFLAVLGATAAGGCSALTAQPTDTETDTEPTTEPATDTETPTPRATETATESAVAQPYAEVYDEVAPSVVLIRVYDVFGVAGQGSGWVYADGTIVTNDHLVSGADTVRLKFRDGDWAEAEVVGTDVYSDLAALSVPSAPDSADPLTLRETDLRIGAEVVVIGSPFGLGGSLTTGVVSGIDRSITGVNNFDIADAVQTDAPVNPGNSGGPVVDLDGDVVGVVSQGGGENVGFAISAALTRRVIPALIEDGSYAHPYMGVGLREVTPILAQVNDLDRAVGVYVDTVMEDGPAAGVLRGSTDTETIGQIQRPVGGDVIRQLDGEPVETVAELSTYLALEKRPGDTLSTTVLRDGDTESVEFTLGERPAPSRF